MASTIPHDPRQVPEAVFVKLPYWHANAAAIGITPAMADEAQALYDEALAAMQAADAARLAARSATLNFHIAAEALREKAAAIVATVRAHAQATDNPAVYTLASIEPPKKPARTLGAPSAPALSSLHMNSSGGMEIAWSARHRNPRGMSGVVYEIRRGLNGARPQELIDTTGADMYIDWTIPPGTRTVNYQVTALRGEHRSRGSQIYTATLHGSAHLLQSLNARAA